MDIPGPMFWWLAAGVVVVAELATGTFYLLMIALGLVAAALAAHLGLGLSAQLAAAAVIGGGATVLWHWRRLRGPRAGPISEDRNVNLDIGERVKVDAWAHDHTTQVRYRGSSWAARLTPGARAHAGEHVVAAVEGNWLVLTPVATS